MAYLIAVCPIIDEWGKHCEAPAFPIPGSDYWTCTREHIFSVPDELLVLDTAVDQHQIEYERLEQEHYFEDA